VLGDAVVAYEFVRRDLDLAPALASHADAFAPAEIIERRISATGWSAALGHHSPSVECGGFGGSLVMRHLLSRICATIAVAR
jgi:hypothetical protein